jgi:hypothetical protein
VELLNPRWLFQELQSVDVEIGAWSGDLKASTRLVTEDSGRGQAADLVIEKQNLPNDI